MKQTLIDFLQTKEKQNGGIALSEQVVFGSIGGSRLYNTSDHNSDYDLRAVTIMPEDYILGIHRFEHSKLNGGAKGITSAGDVDAEVYHYDSFIRRVLNGETNCVEMLFAPQEKQFYVHPIFESVIENKEVFLSKNLIRHYKGLIFSHLNQAEAKLENVKKPEKRERIERYGYETKDMMKVIMYLRICIQFLREGIFPFYREDREELLQIKNGGIPTLEEAKGYAQSLLAVMNHWLATSTLPKHTDITKVNEFMKSYNRDVLRHIGVLN